MDLNSADRHPAVVKAGRRWTVNVNVHGIGPRPRPLDDGEEEVWISVGQFEALLDAIAGHPHVTLTFDDGNSSDVEIALPRLRERGLRARFFVCAGLLGEPGRLDSSAVRELNGAGMVVGSHGWAHRDWRTLDWATRRGTVVEDEMVRSRRHLGRLTGTEVTEVAVPFGSYDRHVVGALRRTGATRVYTSDGGWARSDAWLQPRNSIQAHHGQDWAQRLVHAPPGLPRRLRGKAARAAKRLRG